MEKKLKFEILNDFINVIVFDVAKRYLLKLREKTSKPSELIEDYLDKSILLLKNQDCLEFQKIKKNIKIMDINEKNLFNQELEKNQEYEYLCKELNFAFLLTVDEKLQDRTIELLYKNIYKLNLLIDEEIITRTKINIDSIIEKTPKNKLKNIYIINKNNNAKYINV